LLDGLAFVRLDQDLDALRRRKIEFGQLFSAMISVTFTLTCFTSATLICDGSTSSPISRPLNPVAVIAVGAFCSPRALSHLFKGIGLGVVGAFSSAAPRASGKARVRNKIGRRNFIALL
jgi:hypothetical protein